MLGHVRRSGLILGLALGLVPLFAPPASPGEAPVPSFSKVFAPDTIGPGSATALVFTIVHQSSSPVEELAFTDTLPAGVVVADPAGISNECKGTVTAPAGGSTIALSNGRLGAFSECTITVWVTGSTPGSYDNVTGDLTSSAGNSGTATDTLTVTESIAGFSKSFSPATIPLGATSTLTLVVDNTANPESFDFFSFDDALPTGMQVAPIPNATSDCGGSLSAGPGSTAISVSFASVAAFDSCSVSVDVTTSDRGTFDNLAELQSDGVPVGVAPATLEVPTTFLEKVFLDDPVAPGGTGTLRFTITNLDRDHTATDIAFTDDLDAALAGLTATLPPNPDPPCGIGSSLTGTSTLSFAGGSLAPEASCTFTVAVNVPGDAEVGDHTNTTSSPTATIGGEPVVESPATDILTVRAAPILTKEFIDDPAGTGGTATVEFTITNTSSATTLEDVAFEDYFTDMDGVGGDTTFLPFPVTITSKPDFACGGSVAWDGERISLSGGSIAPGATCSFQVEFEIPVGLATGVYTNVTGNVSGTLEGVAVVGRTATDDLVVVGGPTLTKQFTDDPVEPGEQVTLEFTISHDEAATSNATDITFFDDLAFVAGLSATGLPLNDACGPGSVVSGVTDITLTNGSLAPGADCTFAVTVDVGGATPLGNHTNTTDNLFAVVDGMAVEGAPATDDLTIGVLEFTKEFVDDPVEPGSQVTLRFTIVNPSATVSATSITFFDDLDPDVVDGLSVDTLPATPCGAGSSITTFDPPDITDLALSFTGGELAPGASCEFDVVLGVPGNAVPDDYLNVTSGFFALLDGTAVTLPNANDILTVELPLPPLLTKEFTDDPVKPGEEVTLEFTIENPDPVATMTDIEFDDDLDAVLTGLAATDTPLSEPCGAGSSLTGTSQLTLQGGTLGPTQSCTFSVTLLVPGGAALGTYDNTTSTPTAVADGTPVSGLAASDTLVVSTVKKADLAITKTADSPTTFNGQLLRYTITVENLGPGVARRVVVTDTLPAGVTFLGSDGCKNDPDGAPACTLSTSLAVGASRSFTIVVAVDGAAVGSTLVNTASVASDTPDTKPGNNTSSVETLVEERLTCRGVPATIQGTKGADVLVGTPGDDVIVGRGGNDTIDGRGGNDLICAGRGDDIVTGGSGDDEILGGHGDDQLAGGSGEDLVLGQHGNDTIDGNADDDVLKGNGGNDTISGDGGDDIVRGGGGVDSMSGGNGNDTMFGGGGGDTIAGDRDDDIIRAGRGNDTASGGAGDDVIVGQDGNDTLTGNSGFDVTRGSAGFDVCAAEIEINCEA